MDRCVLLVDDSSFTRGLLKNTILGAGITNILEGKDGNEAIKLYKENKPDLVFMDIMMPEKNGLEALKEIIGFDADAVVIIYTAMQQETVISEAMKSGATEMIAKPISKDEVLSIINKYLI